MQGFRKRGKKAEAERNKKNKGATKKSPARSSDTANPKRQKICEDECDEVGNINIEKYLRVSMLYVNGKRMMQRNG